jgi:hypothetical protein
VLPTFVGENGYSGTYSTSYFEDFPEPDGTNQAGASGTGSINFKITLNPSLTSLENSFGDRLSAVRNATGGVETSQGRQIVTTSAIRVSENSTIANRNQYVNSISQVVEQPPTINSSPLTTVTQETTKTEPYESFYATTKTESEFDDGEGNFTPYESYVWTTTIFEIDTESVTSVTEITTNATVTVVDFKTRPGTRTITDTTGEPVQFKTYTAADGDVLVVAHTIYELNSNTFAATVETPSSQSPITNLSYEPQKFTLFFQDGYAETLTFHKNINEYTQTTTQTTTIKSDVPTTRQQQVEETWKQWFVSFEYTESCDPQKTVERTFALSSPFIHRSTITEETVGNGSQTTFQFFNAFSTQTTFVELQGRKPFSRTGIGDDGSFIQRPRTYTFTNTFSIETSTFFVSGDLTATSTVEGPGFVEKIRFPWRTFGDGAKRLFTINNPETSFLQTTTIVAAPQTIRDDQFVFETNYESESFYLSYEEKKIGQFYRKATNVTFFRNNATEIKAAQLAGLASPDLTYKTENTHSTVGIFMTHNAEHTWEEMNQEAWISQSVVGAVPLTPTFSGLIYRDAEGWQFCDTSKYTSVRGSRVGNQFSTTIAWQTVEGTSTKNSTSSGSFSVNSAGSAEFGVRLESPTIAGGFVTPKAARTVIISPGAVIATTYDASGSGTVSTSLSTGTTYSSALTGPQPITISSLIPRVQGRGVYTQRLIDNGLP